ncbi:MAG: shikimate dehydrogenase family protein [Paludibacteraceae bacterium]
MNKFGLIGFPLVHSFSKKYFTEKFEKERIDAEYNLYDLLEIGAFTGLINAIELTGLNVTIPYKQKVIPYLNELDETAAEIGAVNVIKFIRENSSLKLKGYNSDVIGFMESIRPKLNHEHLRALILGTGGAAKAIDYGLRKLGLQVSYVSRTPKNGELAYSDLDKKAMTENLVVVNATPVGTFPNVDEYPDIPYQFLTPKHLLFDAVYNPAETLFLKKGKEKGADTLNGEGMLIGQAEAAWKIWNSEF